MINRIYNEKPQSEIYIKYKICKNNLKQKYMEPILHKLQNIA